RIPERRRQILGAAGEGIRRDGRITASDATRLRRIYAPAKTIAHTAASITAVASQPTNFSRGLDTNFPITLGLPASSIMTMSTGTEMTPLITALQKRALMGSIGLKVRAVPPSVAKATMV